MATGPDHYAEGERYVRYAEEAYVASGLPVATAAAAIAQAHFAAAHVAATVDDAYGVTRTGNRAWDAVLGEVTS